jgi:hypothetical protein
MRSFSGVIGLGFQSSACTVVPFLESNIVKELRNAFNLLLKQDVEPIESCRTSNCD